MNIAINFPILFELIHNREPIPNAKIDPIPRITIMKIFDILTKSGQTRFNANINPVVIKIKPVIFAKIISPLLSRLSAICSFFGILFIKAKLRVILRPRLIISIKKIRLFCK